MTNLIPILMALLPFIEKAGGALAYMFLPALLLALIVSVLKRLGVVLSDADKAALKTAIADAILAVEEVAGASAKSGVVIPSATKLSNAVALVKESTGTKLSDATLTNLIHASLPKLGLGATAGA